MGQIRESEPFGNDQNRVRELFNRFDAIQNKLTRYIEKSSRRMAAIEEMVVAKGNRVKDHEKEIFSLQRNLERMEQGLLQELKTSQDIMRAMIEHDMNIEKAKNEFRLELEKQESELKRRQTEMTLHNERQREEMKRSLYVKMAGIGAPVLIAFTTFIVKFLERLL